MGTKNNPGKYDCYANAEPDEPLFVLLGRDKNAGALVWLWGVMAEIDGESPEKLGESRESVIALMEWATSKGKKPAGLGVAGLAAMMELIRSANHNAKEMRESKSVPTTMADLRLLLCETRMDEAGPDATVGG
jgi:hypothetical protein